MSTYRACRLYIECVGLHLLFRLHIEYVLLYIEYVGLHIEYVGLHRECLGTYREYL